eukprot:c23070_g1_i6 orf=1066-1503(-)
MAVMNASHFQLFSKVLELCKENSTPLGTYALSSVAVDMFQLLVTVVDSGKRALEILETPRSVTVEAFEINLIITDYCMPGMSGYDLLKRIKGTCALKEIPVVIMSSENVPNRIKRCLAEGAEDFFLKPLQPADMKRLRGHVRPMH